MASSGAASEARVLRELEGLTDALDDIITESLPNVPRQPFARDDLPEGDFGAGFPVGEALGSQLRLLRDDAAAALQLHGAIATSLPTDALMTARGTETGRVEDAGAPMPALLVSSLPSGRSRSSMYASFEAALADLPSALSATNASAAGRWARSGTAAASVAALAGAPVLRALAQRVVLEAVADRGA